MVPNWFISWLVTIIGDGIRFNDYYKLFLVAAAIFPSYDFLPHFLLQEMFSLGKVFLFPVKT